MSIIWLSLTNNFSKRSKFMFLLKMLTQLFFSICHTRHRLKCYEDNVQSIDLYFLNFTIDFCVFTYPLKHGLVSNQNFPFQVNINKRNAILIYTYNFLSAYSFSYLYVTLHVAVVRDSLTVVKTYNVEKRVRLLNQLCYRR